MISNQLDLFDQPVPHSICSLMFNQAYRLFCHLHWNNTKMGNKTKALGSHLCAIFDGRLIHTIGRQDIEAMRKTLATRYRCGLAYTNKAHMIVKLMFNCLLKWKMDGWAGGFNFEALELPRWNPASMVPLPPDPAGDRFITPWEYRKLAKLSKQLNDYALFYTIRLGICFRLSPIDLENLNDNEMKRIDDSHFQFVIRRRHTITPKTPEGVVQIIPIPDRMHGTLKHLQSVRTANSKLFLNWTNMKRRVAKLRKAAREIGIEDFTMRDLRRSGSGELYRRGVDLNTISMGMGHTTDKVTKRHYLPPENPKVRESAKILDEIFS